VLQSLFVEQALPAAHGPQATPPQSASVSAPLRTPSVQLGARQMPPAHTPLVQSALPTHCEPAAHGLQPPPQSTSVSAPFFTESEQLDALQSPPAPQTRLAQSAFPVHISPSAHGAQVLPQSTSVSAPFCTPSVQLACTHWVATHTPLVQSAPDTQPAPV
jgi:hypothetical protein